MEIGRICVKIAGRDAGKKCAIVDVIDDTFVLIDGQTRRKRVNIKHLEPTDKKVDIEKGASHEAVVNEFKKLGIMIKERKPKQKTEKPRKQRKQKARMEGKEAEKPKEKKEAKKEKKQEKPKKEAKKENKNKTK